MTPFARTNSFTTSYLFIKRVRVIDILTAIKERRSIHTFRKEEVPTTILEEIFTYGAWAPNHYMKEPWEIKIYQEHGKKTLVEAIILSYQRIGLIKENKDAKQTIQFISQFLLDIPHHALIHFKTSQNEIHYEEDYAAVCAFIQNSQLAAWKYGVGMLWTITPYMHDHQFVTDIGLDSERDKIAAVMQIGYPEKIPKKRERTQIKEKLTFIS